MFGPSFLADASRKPVLKEWERRLRRCRRSAISKAVLAMANRQPVEDELAAIGVPTLVIVGADDAAIPPVNEQPDTIAKLLSEFLAQHR